MISALAFAVMLEFVSSSSLVLLNVSYLLSNPSLFFDKVIILQLRFPLLARLASSPTSQEFIASKILRS